jgi:hypothetical protein
MKAVGVQVPPLLLPLPLPLLLLLVVGAPQAAARRKTPAKANSEPAPGVFDHLDPGWEDRQPHGAGARLQSRYKLRPAAALDEVAMTVEPGLMAEWEVKRVPVQGDQPQQEEVLRHRREALQDWLDTDALPAEAEVEIG